MPRSLLRELSPREESTLCRVAQGLPNQAGLRVGDVSRLENFGFVEIIAGVPTLTPLGVQRVAIDDHAPASASSNRKPAVPRPPRS